MLRSCLIFFCFIVYSGAILAQKHIDNNSSEIRDSIRSTSVSLHYQNVELRKILSDVSTNYSLSFSYAGSTLPLNALMSVDMENAPLENFLDLLSARLRIGHSVIGINIVLFRETFYEERKREATQSALMDTVIAYPIITKNKNDLKFYKISLWDIILGAKNIQRSLKEDSLLVARNSDSLKAIERKLYRKRVRLIREQRRSNQWGTLSLRPELSIWHMKGTTNQSINYKQYNNYGAPDPGVSVHMGYAIRLWKNFFIQPGLKVSYQTKKGEHTDYYVSFLTPSEIERRVYPYDSRLIFSSFSLQAGLEHKVGKNKITISGGYFTAALIRQTAPQYFPYFETKYYISGPPYYNSNYERIRREEIKYRDWLIGAMADVLFYRAIYRRLDIFAGIHTRIQLQSIYSKEAQISERALTGGISIGVRYNTR